MQINHPDLLKLRPGLWKMDAMKYIQTQKFL